MKRPTILKINNPRKLLVILIMALLIVVVLANAGFIVRGQPARLAGVNHLNELDYTCKSLFEADTYYQSECVYEYGNLLNTNNRAASYEEIYKRMLGEYPWIWQAEEPTTHLAQAGTRLRILNEEVIQFDFASGGLETNDQVDWLINDEDPWNYFLAEPETVCSQNSADATVLLATEESTLQRDDSDQATEMAIITVSHPVDDDSPEAYCIELRYTDDGGASEQREWVYFILPLEEMAVQVEERIYINEVAKIFAASTASKIIDAHLSDSARMNRLHSSGHSHLFNNNELEEGNVIEETEQSEYGFDGSYVGFELVTVDLPDGWENFTRQEKETANPYGCWRRPSIDSDSGRCLWEGYELFGYNGTPDWLTVAVPPTILNEEDAGTEYVQQNYYGCYNPDDINPVTFRCLSGRWNIWSYNTEITNETNLNDQEEEEIFSEEAVPIEAEESPARDWRDMQLYVQTFEDATDKEAYFTANAENHPCQSVISGQMNHVIVGDLYVIYADALLNSNDLQRLFEDLEFSQFDAQALLYDVVSCQTRIDALQAQSLSCQASGSTEGLCASAGLDASLLTDINAVGQTCQAVYDNIDLNDDTDRPDSSDLADCLLLTDAIRQDFIENIQVTVDGEDDHPLTLYGGGGIYTAASDNPLPYVAWQNQTEFSGYGQNTRFQFEKVALHEYFHKFYSRDLTFRQRMRLHKELLALYEDRQSLVFGYLGESDLRGEVGSRTGRHAVRLEEVNSAIKDINAVGSKLILELPDEIRTEYAEFLNDRHGIVAFFYALAEAQVNDDGLKYDVNLSRIVGSKLYVDVLELDFASQFEAVVKAHKKSIDVDTDDDETTPILTISFRDKMSKILPGLNNDRVYGLNNNNASTLEDELEASHSESLSVLYWALRGFLIEGYPILALETTHPFSDWLEGHYNQYFDRSRLTNYFEYHPPLVFEPLGSSVEPEAEPEEEESPEEASTNETIEEDPPPPFSN